MEDESQTGRVNLIKVARGSWVVSMTFSGTLTVLWKALLRVSVLQEKLGLSHSSQQTRN